jgi:dienelactone hydrolase
MRALYLAFVLVFMAVMRAHAQAPVLDATLNETIVQVPKKSGLVTVELETTLFKPEGDGPFPIAVINHGRAAGDSRFQPRYRPLRAARYFLQRGYAVIVPMRQGFSKSGGRYIGGGCNVESNGRVQAEDISATLDWLHAQRWADTTRMVIVGQSHGGWTTLAFGTTNAAGVKGLVNFAGGLRQEDCRNWREQLASAAGNYAKETKTPSLWFYGDNDSYFDVPTWQAMHAQYKASGGQAALVAFGPFGSDSHAMFGSARGGAIWEPPVTKFLAGIGLPSEPTADAAKFNVRTAPAAAAPKDEQQ